MWSRLWGLVLRFLPEPDHSDIEVPLDDGAALDGIRTSMRSFQEAQDRRPRVDGVVNALAEYKRANHFGEKIDYVFLARE